MLRIIPIHYTDTSDHHDEGQVVRHLWLGKETGPGVSVETTVSKLTHSRSNQHTRIVYTHTDLV